MEGSSSTSSQAEGQKQQQQPLQQQQEAVQQQQQQGGTLKRELEREQQQREGAAEEKRQQQEEEGDTQEVINEWLRLRQYATRPRVLAAIDQELRWLGCDAAALTTPQPLQLQQQQHKKEQGEEDQAQQQHANGLSTPQSSTEPTRVSCLPSVYQQPIKLSSGPAAGAPRPSAPFLPLTSFAWDQTADAIKLYVKVPGVQQLPPENIRMHAAARSIELEFVGVGNKNYSFAQKTLSNPINPTNSSYRVKRDMVVVTLRKASPTWWAELSQKRETKLSTPKFSENADPGASIMAMMKNLYEEGDDDMKRMIAKSWTQSQEEKFGWGGKSAFTDLNF